ncbi:hypothetical protein F5Y04DRAFT_277588 [Hypomontagnella monticulosa]|nr:hypothetical protein F5Y04DRAFT_277588 [Hypomontagnella monticulosa]
MVTDQQGKNRRFHKKSRKGCLECKRRHIKCDERRPNCGNCDVAARDCYYAYPSVVPKAQLPIPQSPIHLESQASHEPSPARSGSPSILDHNDLFTLQHLNLFHHVEVGMADWLMVTDAMKPIAQAYITSALSTPFVMNQLLALSAQHLSTVHKDDANTYLDLAAELQARALSTFTKNRQDMSERNIVARFLFSSLIAAQVLSEKLCAPRESFDDFLDGIIEYMNIQRGTRIGELFTGIDELDMSDDEFLPSSLNELYVWFHLANLDEEIVEACTGAVRALGFVHRRISGPNTWGIHAPIAWATFLSGDYISLLENRRPEALVILAHFAIYLHRCRGFWAFGDAGEYLIQAIYKVVGPLWEESMLVPLQALEEVPFNSAIYT